MADELTEAVLRELLGAELARSAAQRLIRRARLLLCVVQVEQAEVVNGKVGNGGLVELGDFVKNIDGSLILALREKELRRLVEGEEEEPETEDGCRRKRVAQYELFPLPLPAVLHQRAEGYLPRVMKPMIIIE